MEFLRDHRRAYFKALIALLLLVMGLPVQAQTTEPEIPPEAAFLAYECEFEAETNSALIRAVLIGADGLPLPGDSYTMTLTQADTGDILPIDKYVVETVDERPPLQMILVLDNTDTVPIAGIVNALSAQLAPQLLVEDEVALIVFSSEVDPITPFFIDKNRLINEYMIDLMTERGDNRLYDAMLAAVNEMPIDSDKRQVILVVTDSGRRLELEQTDEADIINEAIPADIQIYSIGYFSRDRPDINVLREIANETEGYAWIYSEIENTRASIEEAVAGYLDEFITALNSEIVVRVNMQGLETDANNRVTFDIDIDAENAVPLSSRIRCPLERLSHEITFVDDIDDTQVLGSVDIGVNIESDMSLDQLEVAFRLNNEIVETSGQIYTFDAREVPPGYYTIGAQLRDAETKEVLAATPTSIRLFAQQSLEVQPNGSTGEFISGITGFTAIGRPGIDLPPVQFSISKVNEPEVSFPLGGTVAFNEDGRAQLELENFLDTARALFPDIERDEFLQISAQIANPVAGAPPLAISNPVVIGKIPPPPPPPAAAVAVNNAGPSLPLLLIVLFLVLNILLFRWVGRARIKRLIHREDKHPLSRQLMTITVRRNTSKQSHTLTKKTVTVGRGSVNDINLGDDVNISRQHGVIMWRKEQWYYSNRKRRIKSRINGKWARGYVYYKLEPVTEIEIGNTLLIFHSNAQRDLSEFISTNL